MFGVTDKRESSPAPTRHPHSHFSCYRMPVEWNDLIYKFRSVYGPRSGRYAGTGGIGRGWVPSYGIALKRSQGVQNLFILFHPDLYVQSEWFCLSVCLSVFLSLSLSLTLSLSLSLSRCVSVSLCVSLSLYLSKHQVTYLLNLCLLTRSRTIGC